MSFNSSMNLHFDNGYEIHLSFKDYENRSRYGFLLDLLIISHYSHVTYLALSGCREKSVRLPQRSKA